MERALLVTVDLDNKDGWTPEDKAKELKELAEASGTIVVGDLICKRSRISPAYFIGRGKAKEIAFIVQEESIDVVIFNNDLTGTQQKNLEDIIGIKTVDRTQLILDIFARRAKSNEGKVQVELAQLLYLLPRLTGKGIMLSRLGGGIGTRGPGEKKLEVDRRHIHDRIFKLRRDLEMLTNQRIMRRKSRTKFSVCTIAIVGYTNAGKSTLLNAFTDAQVFVQNRLFSTLDPTIRRFRLPTNQDVLFVDTVGFLHNLPHHLIESFKATLEEVVDADMLLHILDATHPMLEAHHNAVLDVLAQLGVKDKSIITVLNKIDLLSDEQIRHKKRLFPNAVAISALKKLRLDELIDKIIVHLSNLMDVIEIELPQTRMDLLRLIYEKGKLIERKYKENNIWIKAMVPLQLKKAILSGRYPS